MITEKAVRSRLRWAAVALLLATGCSDRITEPLGGEAATGEIGAATDFAGPRAVSVTMPNRGAANTQEKAASLFRLFPGGAQVSPSDVATGAVTQTRSVLAARQLPRVRLDYEAKTDTFDAIDVDLSTVRDGVEVSETEARQRFEGVLASLVATRTIGDKDFIPADATVSRVMQGVGDSSGGTPIESVKEYRFYVPRKIGGIVLNDGGQHDLGLRVIIHRSGQLRGIRIEGAGATMSLGSSVPEAVGSDLLDRKVRADFANSNIEPLGLRYSLGAPSPEPRRAYRISRSTTVQGRVVNARAVTVYYSISDPAQPPDVWPIPNPEDKSDSPRPRQDVNSATP